MLLAVNIGNSNIRFGIHNGEDWTSSWTINTKPYKLTDELFVAIKNIYTQYNVRVDEINKVVIGSVVPSQTSEVKQALQRLHEFEPIVVDRHTASDVSHHSSQIGTDLYANAVAAHHLFEGKKLVIDFGTALTFIGIDQSGKIIGVVIAPGIVTSLGALIGQTAQLQDIELKKPKMILGMDTETCMQSGMVYGYLSMIEGMIDRIKAEKGDCTVIATGGLSHIYAPLTHKINHSSRLHTLEGLRFLSA